MRGRMTDKNRENPDGTRAAPAWNVALVRHRKELSMENPYDVLKGQEGKIISYPELCKMTSEEPKRGKGRELHLNRIQQYVNIDFESAPGKLIIREIYPLEKIRIKRRGKTYPYMKDMFLELLQRKKLVNATAADSLRTLVV